MKKSRERGQKSGSAGLRLVTGGGRGARGDERAFTRLFGRVRLFRIAWTFILLLFIVVSGFGAAFASFLMEQQVFQRVTRQPDFSFWIVLILETAKIGTHVVYGVFLRRREAMVNTVVLIFVHVFKFLLVFLSCVCSLAMVAFYLDRPHLQQVRDEDIKRIERRFAGDRARLKSARDEKIEMLKSSHEARRGARADALRAYYEPRITHLEEEIRSEMDNVVGGNFIGPRYKEFERRKSLLQKEYQEKLGALGAADQTAILTHHKAIDAAEAEHRAAVDRLAARERTALSKAMNNGYLDDERVNNKLITAVLKTINHGILNPIGLTLSQVNFTCLFSLLIAVLLELAIYITFNAAVLNFGDNIDLLFASGRREAEVKKNL